MHRRRDPDSQRSSRGAVAAALRLLATGGAALVVLLIGAAGADAATVVFGSDLSQTATRAFPSPYDIAFWSTQLPNGSSTAAPAAGQITTIAIKGCAERSVTNPPGSPNYREPFTQAHFQDLKPQADGSLLVNSTTNPFFTPICGDPGVDQNTVSTFQPISFCVSQGDLIDFNDAGGFDGFASNFPTGVYYDFFAPAPTARTLFFRAPDATNNGNFLTPTPATEDSVLAPPGAPAPPHPYTFNYAGTGSENLELLMQMTLGTGADAPACGGVAPPASATPAPPAANPAPVGVKVAPAVTIRTQTDGVNHARFTTVGFFCAKTTAPCRGTLSLKATGAQAAAVKISKRSVKLGSAHFTVAKKTTGKVRVRLSTKAIALLRKHHRRLTATLTVVLAPGGSFNTFARKIGLKI